MNSRRQKCFRLFLFVAYKKNDNNDAFLKKNDYICSMFVN
jgi:hypothetical protein